MMQREEHFPPGEEQHKKKPQKPSKHEPIDYSDFEEVDDDALEHREEEGE